MTPEVCKRCGCTLKDSIFYCEKCQKALNDDSQAKDTRTHTVVTLKRIGFFGYVKFMFILFFFVFVFLAIPLLVLAVIFKLLGIW